MPPQIISTAYFMLPSYVKYLGPMKPLKLLKGKLAIGSSRELFYLIVNIKNKNSLNY
jgi:hypothetical protein